MKNTFGQNLIESIKVVISRRLFLKIMFGNFIAFFFPNLPKQLGNHDAVTGAAHSAARANALQEFGIECPDDVNIFEPGSNYDRLREINELLDPYRNQLQETIPQDTRESFARFHLRWHEGDFANTEAVIGEANTFVDYVAQVQEIFNQAELYTGNFIGLPMSTEGFGNSPFEVGHWQYDTFNLLATGTNAIVHSGRSDDSMMTTLLRIRACLQTIATSKSWQW
jgi:hypothetical protein